MASVFAQGFGIQQKLELASVERRAEFSDRLGMRLELPWNNLVDKEL